MASTTLTALFGGRGIGGGGGGPPTLITSDHTAVSGDFLAVDTTGGPIAITLPASGVVTLEDSLDTWLTHAVTFAGITSLDGDPPETSPLEARARVAFIGTGGVWRTKEVVELFPFG